MAHESTIRLPTRLRGVVRADAPALAGTQPNLLTEPPARDLAPPLPAPTLAGEAERKHIQKAVAALRDAAAALKIHQQKLAEQVEPLAVELAIAVAEHFLRTKVSAGEFPFAVLIRQAVERLESRHPVVVALHPEDLLLLQKALGDEPQIAQVPDAQIVADATLPRGAFRVQNQDHSVRFDWENRLASLRQQLLDSMANLNSR